MTFSWNCFGLENTETVQRIREIHKQISPDVFFLMETKNPDDFMLKELDFLDQYKRILVPPRDQIVVAWLSFGRMI